MNGLADLGFRTKRILVGGLKVRRTQVFCVGTAKSGTHSVASMFSKNVRAGHEKEVLKFIEAFFCWQEGKITEREYRDWLAARDREMALEIESSWFHGLIVDLLASEFPKARFILTIRDGYSWLNSEFKRVLHTPSRQPQRVKMREFVYNGAATAYAPEELVLKENGLFPVDNYLARWAAHNEKVLAMVPPERLLVVRTEQIGARAFEIADFAGLPRCAIQLQRTHEYQNPVQREIIRELDSQFVEQKVEQHCRPLMKRFFPEIKTLADVKF
jgi:Sulfotransferase domain